MIDYTKEDYTKSDQALRRDLRSRQTIILLRSAVACLKAWRYLGVLAGIGGSGMHEETLSRVVGTLTASVRSKFADEKFATFGVKFDNKDLGILRDLAESGKMIPAVTKIYPLTENRRR